MENPNTIEHWNYVYGLDKEVPMGECYRYDEPRFSRVARFVTGRAIDYGCGLGYFSKYCSDNGILVDGCDWSEVALSSAREVCQGVSFYRYEEINPFDYDTISLQEVIEHMDEPGDFLKEVRGKIVITTPRKDPGGGAMHSAEHVREYSVDELAELVEKYLKITHFEIISAAYGTCILLVAEHEGNEKV
jgi:2-polyprenyl-3-methyl-5-hydroxy-6-metoxy-1,4-benzoquinol methylase